MRITKDFKSQFLCKSQDLAYYEHVLVNTFTMCLLLLIRQ